VIAIDKVLISDEIVEEQFVCDLNKCKGGCCEDGEAGAPLEKHELALLKKYHDIVKPYLTAAGIAELEKQGSYVYHQEFGWVTPTIEGKMCAYGYKDSKGIIKCGIEQAYNDGKIDWKKPISCHLYPIRVTKTRNNEMLNYEPREDLCSPACVLGRKLKVPTYVFLKESIIRKYGEEFYNVLSQVAKDYYEARKTALPKATGLKNNWPKDQNVKNV
jgi:hypothetical protein